MGSSTSSRSPSRFAWIPSGCSGPRPTRLVSLGGSPATKKQVEEGWRKKMSFSLWDHEGCKFCLDNRNVPPH